MGKVLSYHDNQKPFGVVKESKGRGTMKFLGYYGLEEDVDGFFPIMKTRLLQVIGEWVQRGWITPAEISEATYRYVGAQVPSEPSALPKPHQKTSRQAGKTPILSVEPLEEILDSLAGDGLKKLEE